MKINRRLVTALALSGLVLLLIWHVAFASWVAVCPFGAGSDTSTPFTITTRVGQTFETPSTSLFTQIEGIYFDVARSAASPSGNVIMEFWRADSNGHPSGSALRTITKLASDLNTGSATPTVSWNDDTQCTGVNPLPNDVYLWTFSPPYTVAPENTYVVTFRRTSTTTGTVAGSKRADGSASGVYEDGKAIISTDSGATWSDLLSGADDTDIKFIVMGAGDGSFPATATPVPAEKAVRDYADSLGFTDTDSQMVFGLLATALVMFIFFFLKAGLIVSAGSGALTFLAFVGIGFIPDWLLITLLTIGGIIIALIIAKSMNLKGEE